MSYRLFPWRLAQGPPGKIAIHLRYSSIITSSASMMKEEKVASWLGKQKTSYYIFKYKADKFCFKIGLAFCQFLQSL